MTESSKPAPPLSIAELDVVSKFGLDKPEEATVPLLPTRGIRGPWGYPKVRGVCPSCGALALFAASGGYITCANLQCPNPTAVADSLEKPVVLSPKDEPTDEDWMFECDAPGCSAVVPSWEPLRHTGDSGAQTGRVLAGLIGWVTDGVEDYCPEHVEQLASQPKLDPMPFVGVSVKYGEFRGSNDSLFPGQMRFLPRPEFSQVESQYPHRKA